jgi:hypothetical protein
MTFAEFQEFVDRGYPAVSEHQRYGQHWFNMLNEVHSVAAGMLRATRLDPFYRDHVSDETKNFIASIW